MSTSRADTDFIMEACWCLNQIPRLADHLEQMRKLHEAASLIETLKGAIVEQMRRESLAESTSEKA